MRVGSSRLRREHEREVFRSGDLDRKGRLASDDRCSECVSFYNGYTDIKSGPQCRKSVPGRTDCKLGGSCAVRGNRIVPYSTASELEFDPHE